MIVNQKERVIKVKIEKVKLKAQKIIYLKEKKEKEIKVNIEKVNMIRIRVKIIQKIVY